MEGRGLCDPFDDSEIHEKAFEESVASVESLAEEQIEVESLLVAEQLAG